MTAEDDDDDADFVIKCDCGQPAVVHQFGRGWVCDNPACSALDPEEKDPTDAVAALKALERLVNCPLGMPPGSSYCSAGTCHECLVQRLQRHEWSCSIDKAIKSIPNGWALDHLCQHYRVGEGKATLTGGATCKLGTDGGGTIKKVMAEGETLYDAIMAAIAKTKDV